MDLKPFAFSFPEPALTEKTLLATYYLEIGAGENLYEKTAALAIGQTIGTWTAVPGITEEMLRNHMGKVVNVFEVPPVELTSQLSGGKRSAVVQIAFPEENFGPQFPLLLTTLLGNDVSTAAQIKLLDIQISKELAHALGGPRFGLAGIRRLTGIAERPLILNVLKPCTGFPPEAAAGWFEESARAGSDIIKDDELLANAGFNQLEQRVKIYHQAAQRVFEETGHRTLYCANVTDRADLALINARRVVECGADLVMINAVTAGLGVLQALAADPDLTVPILAHFAGFGMLTESQTTGISSPLLLGKMLRLAGADAVSFPSPYSAYPMLPENFVRIGQYLRLTLHDVLPTLPVPGGGIHPRTAVAITRDLGPDIMLTVGGAIQGHPMGAAAGVIAMRAALAAAMEGQALDDKAGQVPELLAALARWQ